jgi:multidrug resistance efflux pump
MPSVSRVSRRFIKIAVASAVLATGAYAVWSAQGLVVSDNAVVSAYVVSLRTPIDGYVAGNPAPVGSEVGGGAVLATVTNPRVDDQRLADLKDRVQRLALEKTAIVAQRDSLEATRAGLVQRAEEFRRAKIARLSGQTDAAARALEARLSEAEQARREYARKTELVRTGTASKADLDRSQYGFEALEGQARSLAAQLASVKAEYDAAVRGVMTDAGGNDVVYSMQRADEVGLRIAELDRAMATATAEAAEADSRLAVEARRIALLRSADMTAPSGAMIWKIGSTHGERVGIGDTTAELVDCGAAFLVAAIPQSASADVATGGEARFRLAGETQERTGTILSVIGDASLLGDRNLAAVPFDPHRPTAMVRIAVPPSRNVASECLVGRTARVLLPATERGLMETVLRFMRRIF